MTFSNQTQQNREKAYRDALALALDIVSSTDLHNAWVSSTVDCFFPDGLIAYFQDNPRLNTDPFVLTAPWELDNTGGGCTCYTLSSRHPGMSVVITDQDCAAPTLADEDSWMGLSDPDQILDCDDVMFYGTARECAVEGAAVIALLNLLETIPTDVGGLQALAANLVYSRKGWLTYEQASRRNSTDED